MLVLLLTIAVPMANKIESRNGSIKDVIPVLFNFMGGLIYGLQHYQDDSKALEFATAASCLKHTLKGDFNWVTAQEVENIMDSRGTGRIAR